MSAPHHAIAASRRHVREALTQAGAGTGSRLVVAVSGGSDSMALALAAAYVARHEGMLVTTITVDHGIREESYDEARGVCRTLADLGIADSRVARVDVAHYKGGPEGSARQARYDAIAQVSAEFERPFVLLGHTADDQAETVLLGLGRGSGARSIRGMSVVGRLPGHPEVTAVRPLLRLRREALREGLRSEGVSWVDDPTNDPDSSWTTASGEPLRRSAIRHTVIPALNEALGPGVVEALARTAQMLHEDEEALSAWARSYADACEDGVEIAHMRSLPTAVRRRVLRLVAIRSGARAGDLTHWHIRHLDDLVMGAGGSRRIDLPGVCALTRGGYITFSSVGLESNVRKDAHGYS
ncbi:tRNA lysidine(34) synthetase TilS [Arcanobacterium haemolyticum]|nr:tRNA lysidine(34) synthetase TilS [Arcanobacterium haemolyticum]